MKETLMNKLILTDVDGVLLNWSDGFDQWMAERGYDRVLSGEYELGPTYGIDNDTAHKLAVEFNSSDAIGDLEPLRDSVKYVKKLYEEHGFRLHCITAIPDTQKTYLSRSKNLARYFGDAIYRLNCTDSSKNKHIYLREYIDTGMPWIEDRIEMAELGERMGLTTYLIDHDYNQHLDNNDIMRVKNWKELYEILT